MLKRIVAASALQVFLSGCCHNASLPALGAVIGVPAGSRSACRTYDLTTLRGGSAEPPIAAFGEE